MKNKYFKIISVIFVFVIVCTPLFHVFFARYINNIRQEYIIQNARTRVQTYEWFYDMYEQIEATKKKAELAKGTQEEIGIKMVLSSMISEYNAKAKMEWTKGQWKADDLPKVIEQ